MKSVLIYGDSQTWGRLPGVPERLPYAQRWTTVMAAALGPDVVVIVEALNGRTTCRDEPWRPWRNGAEHLDFALTCHAPLDAVVIALGSNDLQWHQHLGAYESTLGAQALLDKVTGWRGEPDGPPPRPILLAPPRIAVASGPLQMKFRGAEAKTGEQQVRFRQLAVELDIPFLSMADVAEPSPIDGVHLDEHGHRKLGEAMAPIVAAVLGISNRGADTAIGRG